MKGSMAQEYTILVVDDEPRIVEVIRMNLELDRFRVVGVSSGHEALELIAKTAPDLVVLDVVMPDMDGFATLRRIREISQVPVIFLTVKGEECARVFGLTLGADDYLTKPFSPQELACRIRAVLRRTKTTYSIPRVQIVVDDSLSIDFDRRMVIVHGHEMHLRPTEYRLLYQLVKNAGQLVTHESLLSAVWGPEYRGEHHYIRLYINYLRSKIEEDPKNPQFILSERGLGYRFKALDESLFRS